MGWPSGSGRTNKLADVSVALQTIDSIYTRPRISVIIINFIIG